MKLTNWCVPGDFRGEFIFRLERMRIYSTKNKGMIEEQFNQEKSDSRKIADRLVAIRNVSYSEQRYKGHVPIRLPAVPAGYHRLITGGARQMMLAAWPPCRQHQLPDAGGHVNGN